MSQTIKVRQTRGRQAPRTREVDAKPIIAERKRAEALRARKGLAEAWTAELNRVDADLRIMAQNLMAMITDFLVAKMEMRQRAPQWRFA